MKKTKSGVEEGKGGGSPSQRIDARIKELSDWRGETLARIRALIKQADPEVVEEWKWVKPTKPGTPVWSHAGMICTGDTYKNVVFEIWQLIGLTRYESHDLTGFRKGKTWATGEELGPIAVAEVAEEV
jgi:hypothetical protein